MLDIRIVIGRLTRDPEVKEVAADLKVARFTVACDGDFKDKDGNKKTEFVDAEAWRQSADFAENYLGKGRLVAIVGRMKTDEWEDSKFVDENGASALRRKGVLTVDRIYPLDKPAGSDDAAYETPENGGQQQAPARNSRPANNTRGGNTRGGASQSRGNSSQGQGSRPLPQW